MIPAYNEEALLPGCLDSILAQVRGHECDVEIIVVNNASTDGTREVALRYPGLRLVDEPRKGLPFARQAGFLASTGTLIANVDADSRLTPGWVDAVLSAFAADSGLVALSGPLLYYDLSAWERDLVQVFYLFAFAAYLTNRFVLRAGSMVQGGNFVLRRQALDAIGGFNLDIPFYGEDTDIARRLQPVGRVRFTLGLKMSSSGRRLKREGVLTIGARYAINYLWMIFFKRPYTHTYVDIRPQPSSSL